jgi:alkyl hydroperoxide reductase subunit AhpC
MIELGQLESHHDEFDKRQTRILVASTENAADAKLTQADFPHLLILADTKLELIKALGVMDPRPAPVGGGSMAAPTTFLVDKNGVVRWIFRPSRVIERLSPTDLAAAIDENLAGNRH